jgi:deoxycytidine triphosphate deaminase
MILEPKILLELVKEKKLVENLSERELTNPEGAGFDLRLGKVFKLKGDSYLGIDERKTPDVELVAEFDPKKVTSITILPGELYLTESYEKFNMPLDLVGILKPRTTLQRSGIIARMAIVDPGYSGTVHPLLFNAGPANVTIELGARYIFSMFMEIKGKGSQYRGQWQGGRVAATKKEKQV